MFIDISFLKFPGRRRLLTRIKAKDHDGYFKTDVSFPRNPMMGRRSPTTNCLYGFWIVYIRDARSDLGIYIFFKYFLSGVLKNSFGFTNFFSSF